MTQVAPCVESRAIGLARSPPWPATLPYCGIIALSRCSSDGAPAYTLACAANMSTHISMDSYFFTTAGSTGRFRLKRRRGSPPDAALGPLDVKHPATLAAARLVAFLRHAAERPH